MIFFLLLLSLHLLFLTSTRFTLWPEMIVYPYLLNNGFAIYRDIINPYFPSFIYLLALIEKVFGNHLLGYQIFTWATILTIDVLIFYIAKKITNKISSALLASSFFVIFSIPFGANNLWFDLAQTPFILLSIYFFFQFIKDTKTKNALFLSSLFVTIAFFIKQQTTWLIAYFLLVLMVRFGKKSTKIISSNPIIILPALILLLVHLIYFAIANLHFDFLFWTFYFPYFLASSQPGYILLPTVRQILPIISLYLFFIPLIFDKKNKLNFFVTCSIPLLFFAYPRFDYFHLIPALSTLSIVAGENLKLIIGFKNKKDHILQFLAYRQWWTIHNVKGKESTTLFLIVSLSSLFFLTLFSARYYLKNMTNDIRFFEKEIYQTADLIQKVTSPLDSIYIQNGPDQILPLANRLPTKPWADEFPWYLEVKNTQDKVLAGIKVEDPQIVLFKPYEEGEKHVIGVYRPAKIADYLDQNYQNFQKASDLYWLKIKNGY